MRRTHGSPKRDPRSLLDRIPVGAMSALAILLLGLLAGIVVLLVIPSIFGIESSCVGAFGAQRTAGDTFVAGFVVLSTLGWLGVFLGTIFASIADRRDIVVLLPVLWFLTLVLAALVVAVFLGPEHCPR